MRTDEVMPLGHDCEGREEPTVTHTALYRAMLARIRYELSAPLWIRTARFRQSVRNTCRKSCAEKP